MPALVPGMARDGAAACLAQLGAIRFVPLLREG